jgi:hypothetical protein
MMRRIAFGSKAVLLNGGKEVRHGRKESREVPTSGVQLPSRRGQEVLQPLLRERAHQPPGHFLRVRAYGVCCWGNDECGGIVLFLGLGQEYDCCRSKNMRKALQTALLIGAFAAGSFSQQAPDRRFVQPPSLPELVPPGFLADRDPVRVDPQHFRLDCVRVVHLTMKGSEGSPMHEEPDILAVCIKECHLRLTRPDGKIQDLHMQAGDARWVGEDTRSEKNLGKEPLEMLLIEIKGERPTSN